MTEINCKDNVLRNCDKDLKFSPHVNENPIKILDNEIIFVPVEVCDLKVISEISQNYMIRRNPEAKTFIRQKYSQLFIEINK